ncbi:phage minor head protein [Luteimicrobium sp. NPDC057192]|uniref:phage minor head protein n=1 Tax=Luteimicrobium sp. NPDC057192 TaxID=3346042 RepID=UPI003634419C
MAVNDKTLRLIRRMRASIDKHVDQATRDLVAAWVTTWDDLVDQWQVAIDDLLTYQAANGAWPPAWRIARLDRVTRALQATQAALDDLAATTGTTILGVIPDLTAETVEWGDRILDSQLPPETQRGGVSIEFNRVDPASLQAIVERTTQQVTALTRPLSAEATAAMNRHLVRGVALGDNPRTAAAHMLRDIEGGFNGGLTRALTIARTEMLDAHRAADLAHRNANTDTLTGWTWLATLDRRTCPSCLAMNGQTFPPGTPGPNDHQNGRCIAVPTVKSWRDLGFHGITEPEDTFPDARTWFDGLSDEDQRAVMGPQRLELLKSGDVTWDDLTTTKSTPGWRTSQVVTPVSALLTAA